MTNYLCCDRLYSTKQKEVVEDDDAGNLQEQAA
nr:MAG TPA: hypothetical protein [Caudoviricetes sp.]